jgi:hypothetical protein
MMAFDRRYIRFRALMAITMLLMWHRAGADEWGHKLPGQPSQFIFGYGSLIDEESRNKTVGSPLDAIAVRVSSDFGYVRAWVDRCACGFTALGLRKPHAGEAPMTINGVIYPVDGSNLPAFDLRESGYRRLPVPRTMIEAVSWQGLPETGDVWVYVPDGPSGEPGADLPDPSANFPILQSYVDVVLHGALRYGPDFAREIIQTTAGWGVFWLNDRELPRRPWVHSSDYQAIDSLLGKVEPASDHLNDRLFSEEFTARYLTPLAQPRH